MYYYNNLKSEYSQTYRSSRPKSIILPKIATNAGNKRHTIMAISTFNKLLNEIKSLTFNEKNNRKKIQIWIKQNRSILVTNYFLGI